MRELEGLLVVPVSAMGMGVLALTAYADLLSLLPWGNRRTVALELLRSIVCKNTLLSDAEQLDRLFVLIAPLIRDQEGASDPVMDEEAGAGSAGSAFEEEQTLVARAVHLISHADTDALFRLYMVARRHFGQGGVHRIQHTLVPLIFAALRLARAVKAREGAIAAHQAAVAACGEGDEAAAAAAAALLPAGGAELQYSTRKVFQFTHEVATAMATRYPELSLKLFLLCAQGADECGFSAIAYEFVASALMYYENELADTKQQIRALTLLAGSLLNCKSFDESDYELLITKTTQHASKLLTKPMQSRMVATCSHLFWAGREQGEESSRYRDARRVLECLQRAIIIADNCLQSSVSNLDLFVELLEHYVYYFERGNSKIEPRHLEGLISLVNEHIDRLDAGDRAQLAPRYRNTIEHLRRKQADPETAARFGGINLAAKGTRA